AWVALGGRERGRRRAASVRGRRALLGATRRARRVRGCERRGACGLGVALLRDGGAFGRGACARGALRGARRGGAAHRRSPRRRAGPTRGEPLALPRPL